MRDRVFIRGVGLVTCMVLTIFVVWAPPPVLAEPQACGNVNGAGLIDLADLAALIDGLTNCTALPNPADADVDGYQGISYRDLGVFTYRGTHPTYPLDCSAQPPIYPTQPGTCLNVLNGIVPPNVTAVTCTLFVRYTDTLWGFTLPIEFLVEGVPVQVTAARGMAGGPDTLATGQLRRQGSVLLAFEPLNLNLLPGTWLFAEADLVLPSSSPSARELTIAYGSPTFCGAPYDYASPWLFKKGEFAVVTPTLGCSCCDGTTGNVNLKGIVDLADLSMLIAYLVADGPLICRDAANTNGTGIVDLADLSTLIAFISGAGGTLAACP